MKKQFSGFLCGVLSMALVGTLGVTALAAGGEFSPGQFGLSLFGKPQVAEGEQMNAENGQPAPVVVTYTDGQGGATNYVAVRKIAELFDARLSWREGTVAIAPKGGGDVTVALPGESVAEEPLPDKPVYGVKAGAYTEVDPAELDRTGTPMGVRTLRAQSSDGLEQQIHCVPGNGAYLLISITNHGDSDRRIQVYRRYTISVGETEPFTTVRLAPGQTLDRVFAIQPDASELTYTLEVSVDGVSHTLANLPTDVTITTAQYPGK